VLRGGLKRRFFSNPTSQHARDEMRRGLTPVLAISGVKGTNGLTGQVPWLADGMHPPGYGVQLLYSVFAFQPSGNQRPLGCTWFDCRAFRTWRRSGVVLQNLSTCLLRDHRERPTILSTPYIHLGSCALFRNKWRSNDLCDPSIPRFISRHYKMWPHDLVIWRLLDWPVIGTLHSPI